MSKLLFRIQDGEGRGPYRPGFSHLWTDADHSARNPTFLDEFGQGFLRKIRHGEHVGCALASMDQAEAWFSKSEIARLQVMGFMFVSLSNYRILEQSQRQTIFASLRPLWACCSRVSDWPHQRSAA